MFEPSKRTNKKKPNSLDRSRPRLPEKMSTEDERNCLNNLNVRFEKHLEEIRLLVSVNENLREQIKKTRRNMVEGLSIDSSIELELTNLKKNLNEETRLENLEKIRLSRALSDLKFYQNKLKISTDENLKSKEEIRKFQLKNASILEKFDELKTFFGRNEENCLVGKNFLSQKSKKKFCFFRFSKLSKTNHDETLKRLVESKKEFDKIQFERSTVENEIQTLREEISFCKEIFQRRSSEFEILEAIRRNSEEKFVETETRQILMKIRFETKRKVFVVSERKIFFSEDFQKFNEIRRNELEIFYAEKLVATRRKIDEQKAKEENSANNEKFHRQIEISHNELTALTEENSFLTKKIGEHFSSTFRVFFHVFFLQKNFKTN